MTSQLFPQWGGIVSSPLNLGWPALAVLMMFWGRVHSLTLGAKSGGRTQEVTAYASLRTNATAGPGRALIVGFGDGPLGVLQTRVLGPLNQ